MAATAAATAPQSAWAIGLDQRRPFTVTTVTDPPRIVIDVATS
jgi:hypothetical protein